MKTLPILTALIGLTAALAALPFGFEVSVSTFFATGLLGILFADYAHVLRPQAQRVTAGRSERLRLAA